MAVNGNKHFSNGRFADFMDKMPSIACSVLIVIDGKLIGVADVAILLIALQEYFNEIGESGSNIASEWHSICFVATDSSIIMKETTIM